MTDAEFPHGHGWYPTLVPSAEGTDLSVPISLGHGDRVVDCALTPAQADLLRASSRRYWIIFARAQQELGRSGPTTDLACRARLHRIVTETLDPTRDEAALLARPMGQDMAIVLRTMTPDATTVFPELATSGN